MSIGTLPDRVLAKYRNRQKPAAVVSKTTTTVVAKKPKITIKKRKAKPSNLMSLFKPMIFTKMRYSEQITLYNNYGASPSGSGTGGTTANAVFGDEQVYRLASIYNARTTLPAPVYRTQGYDQVAGVYDKYRVYGALVHVKFTDPSADGLSIACAIQGSQEVYALAGQNNTQVAPKKWTVIKPINNTGKQEVHYSRYIDFHKVDGLNKTQFMCDSNYASSMNSNPAISPYLRIAVSSLSGTTSVNVKAVVTVDYYVQFYQRAIIPSSTV